jgi:branched-chain amino acid transport system substrate-binding protein
MSCSRRALVTGLVSIGVWLGLLAIGGAQPPIRIGASIAQTGPYAAPGQNQLRGYRLCVKHANEKGGVLGRKLELLVEDDRSEPATAARIYEKVITQDRVDAVLGPYASPITEAVADVTEKHRMPMVATQGATTSTYRKGRKFVYMVPSPAEVYLEGVVDIAAKRGLKTIAVIGEDLLFAKAVAQGTADLARRKSLEVVVVAAYPRGTTDFTAILTRVRTANPDVLAAATYFEDAVGLTRQLKQLDVNPRMFAVTVGGDLLKFYEQLGPSAEFVYGAAQWEPELVKLRAGGLIPVARQYPGAREFFDAYQKEFAGADFSYHSAGGYGGCQILVEAIKRAGSLDGEKIREAILRMDINTVYGGFRVDPDGFQIAHKMVTFQWQDGKKVIVWPEELAPGKPRFPTPPWSQRP